MENLMECLKLAKGEFVTMASDDDIIFPRGVEATFEAVRSITDNKLWVGSHGTYSLEQSNGSHGLHYQHLGSPRALERVQGYSEFPGPNLLFYSTIRRSVMLESMEWAFVKHPLKTSFNDQLCVLWWLLKGQFKDVGRFIFSYDNGNWESINQAAKRDADIAAISHTPKAVTRMHWLACGLEGALLAKRFGEIDAGKVWFDLQYKRFKADMRDSEVPEAEALAKKWREAKRIVPKDILSDLCTLIAMTDKPKADAYKEFWA